MRIISAMVLCLFSLSVVVAGEKDEKTRQDFQKAYDDILYQIKYVGGTNIDVLLGFSPSVKKLHSMGVSVVPLLIEKVRSCERRLAAETLVVVATAILLDKPIKAKEVWDLLFDICGKFNVSVKPWLKWWEEEGKKLYEKRMKELKEKEKAQEKPETQEPEKQPKEQPPPEKTEPEQKPPSEGAQTQPEVEKQTAEKAPETDKAAKPVPPPEGSDGLTTVLIIAGAVLAGAVIVLLLRRRKGAAQP
jgi:hypothetical protein